MKRYDLAKSGSDSLLLCLLEEKSMYGYQIIKEMEQRSQGYFKYKEGTLYPALHRLERAGLISSEWQILANGRNRRYYSITSQGTTRLARERIRWHYFIYAMKLILQPGSAEVYRTGGVTSGGTADSILSGGHDGSHPH